MKERAMNKIDDTHRKRQPAPLQVSRVFSAPPETVFKAWSSAEHVKRWFCPSGYSVPDATVEMRAGGRFEVCIRSPEGMEHWTKGTFTEVPAPERLTIDHHVIDPCGGGPLFSAVTQVKLSPVHGGTLMEVVQTYTVADPAQAEPMLKGAPEGWRQTLDKLEAEIARIQGSGGGRSVVHGVFHLERTYDATPEQVYKALSDEAAKNRWFYGPQGWRPIERFMDFRVGGRERAKGRFEGGVTTTFDAIYHDIVPRERIVYTYEMHLDDRKISVSLATLQIEPAGAGRTKLKVSEQGAFLDGYDDAGSRERASVALATPSPSGAPHSSFDALRSFQPIYSPSRASRSRTPMPPPSSLGRKTAPAVSSAMRILSTASFAMASGAPVSSALIADTGTPAVSANFACDQPIRARAALTCAASTMDLSLFRRCRGYRDGGGGR